MCTCQFRWNTASFSSSATCGLKYHEDGGVLACDVLHTTVSSVPRELCSTVSANQVPPLLPHTAPPQWVRTPWARALADRQQRAMSAGPESQLLPHC